MTEQESTKRALEMVVKANMAKSAAVTTQSNAYAVLKAATELASLMDRPIAVELLAEVARRTEHKAELASKAATRATERAEATRQTIAEITAWAEKEAEKT